MEKKQICHMTEELWAALPGNVLAAEGDILPEHAGTAMFDPPLIGVGSASDPLFNEFKKPGVIGPWHWSPSEWLPGAQTVISFFFPMTEAVRRSNRESVGIASQLWAYDRIEGQAFIDRFMEAVAAWFREQGYEACIPCADPRWQGLFGGRGIGGYPEIREDTYGSRWSERHAAYLCGLGTFGLSKGLITARGMAGRFGSVVVSAECEPDPRPYTGVYDYCIHCGACARRCPAGAIDLETGKDHVKCSACVSASARVLAPRYGCGLCQTGVPCEVGIPKKPAQKKDSKHTDRGQ